MPRKRKRRSRHIDRANQWRTRLVIGLCILATVAVVCGMLYDRTRVAEPIGFGTHSLHIPALPETDAALPRGDW